MAKKTCRTCNSAHYVRSCPMIGTKRRAEVWPDEEDCYYHVLRETPLLVDVLAKALKGILHCPYQPYYSCSKEVARITAIEARARAALARYEEEVGDA